MWVKLGDDSAAIDKPSGAVATLPGRSDGHLLVSINLCFYMGSAGGTVRVLHVDDDPEIANVTATFLEQHDERLAVETALGAVEGLDRLSAATDCVVSDHDMPAMNGIEFLEAVRESHPNLPFILFTGKGSEAVASEAISAGVTDYLQKTVGNQQYELLCNRINNAVARHRAQTNYQELIERLPVGLTIHDPDTGAITHANQRLAELLGYDTSELEGTHPGELAPAETEFDRATADRFIEQTIESGRQQFEWQDETNDGDEVWVEVTCKQTQIDNKQRVLAVVETITDRKQRERDLKRIERRYQAIVSDPNVLIGLLDPDGTVREINDTAMEYVDTTRARVTDTPFWETPWLEHSEYSKDEARELIGQAAAGAYYEFETSLVRPTGEPSALKGGIRPVTDDTGTVVSLLVVAREGPATRRTDAASGC